MLMARTRRNCLKEHWLKDALLNSKLFLASTARHRLLSIPRMLYFSNNADETEGDQLLDKFLIVFHDSFTPFQDFCVYESLALFKERLNFKQYCDVFESVTTS
jgi:hypothetical protein